MAYFLLVTNTVLDYSRWKSRFEADAHHRERIGLKTLRLFRDPDSDKIVTLLFSVEDLEKARAFVNSPELQALMLESGIMARSEARFMME